MFRKNLGLAATVVLFIGGAQQAHAQPDYILTSKMLTFDVHLTSKFDRFEDNIVGHSSFSEVETPVDIEYTMRMWIPFLWIKWTPADRSWTHGPVFASHTPLDDIFDQYGPFSVPANYLIDFKDWRFPGSYVDFITMQAVGGGSLSNVYQDGTTAEQSTTVGGGFTFAHPISRDESATQHFTFDDQLKMLWGKSLSYGLSVGIHDVLKGTKVATDANGHETIESVIIKDNSLSHAYSGTMTLIAVPEPELWAMIIFGFAFVGFALRRARDRHPAKISHA